MSLIFETERLFVRALQETDADLFFDLMSNRNVMNMVPEPVLDREKSDSELRELMQLEQTSDIKIWSLCKKKDAEFIGFAGLLKNAEAEDEIAYRIREQHWNQGFGTEITKGLLDFGFGNMNMNLITADVFVENARSIKILEKFFTLQKEFFNAADNCTDRKYIIKKENWFKTKNKQ